MLFATGTFTKDSSGCAVFENIDIGFEAKWIFLWGQHQITSDTISTSVDTEFFAGWDTLSCPFKGVSSSFAIGDGLASTDSHTTGSQGSGGTTIRLKDICSVNTLIALVNPVSNGFQMYWSTPSAVATIVHYLAIGGRGFEREAYEFPLSHTVAEQNSEVFQKTSLAPIEDEEGFLMLFQRGGQTSFANANFGLGFATSPSKEASVVVGDDAGLACTETAIGIENDQVHSILSSGAVNYLAEANFVTWTCCGFTLDYTCNPSSGSADTDYIVTHGTDTDVGVSTSNTCASTKSFTTAFKPKALLMVQTNMACLGLSRRDVSFDISAATDCNSGHSAGYGSEDAVACSNVISASTTSALGRVYTMTGTECGSATLDSFNGGCCPNFTLDYTCNPTASSVQFMWVALSGQCEVLESPTMTMMM